MSNNDLAIDFNITDIRAYGLLLIKPSSRFSIPQKFYLKVTIPRTHSPVEADLTLKADCHVNASPFRTFQALKSDTVKLQIFARHTLHLDSCVGDFEDSVHALLKEAETSGGAISRSLRSTAKDKVDYRLEFTIKPVSDPSRADMLQIVEQVGAEAERLSPPPLGSEVLNVVTNAPEACDKIVSILDTWSILLVRVEIFVNICDKVSEIHPYAKLASSVLLVVPQILLSQIKRDSNMNSLIVVMRDIFEFVEAAEPLKKVEAHSRIITSMVQQVTECGYFIHHYLRKPNFWERTLANTFSKVDSQISDYISRFESLQNAFQREASRDTNIGVRKIDITVVSILDNLEKHGEMLETHVIDNTLERMQYSRSARYNPERGCLPGTRQKIISDIVKWVNDPEGSSVFLLSGVAGSGKSSIAHSIAALFAEQRRLGSSFCFDRNDATDRRPEQLFYTIARDLAYYDSSIKRELYDTIKKDESILRSPSPLEQFRKLIQNTVGNVEGVGPTVVMVDALDESAGQSRTAVIKVLSEGNFPENLRFLVSSRPDNDIIKALHNRSHIKLNRLDEVDRIATESDILICIQSWLSASPDVQLTDAQYNELVKLSDGLFQWAFTACRFVLGDGPRSAGEDPIEKLEQILALQPDQANPLDVLYGEVLNYAVGKKDEKSLAALRLALGRVLTAVEPLSISSLKALFKNEYRKFDSVLPFLGSLLKGVTETDSPIRPLHASLRDFLLDEKRAGDFYINLAGKHNDFAGATLNIMSDSLHFNICHINTSYRKNDQISQQVVDSCISPTLKYACLFWSKHLMVDCSQDTLSKAESLLQSKFLYWLEVLSILGAVDKAAPALSVLISKSRAAIKKSALDAQRFIRSFAIPISQSAPHIYITAWSLAPKQYKTRGCFLPGDIPNSIILRRGALTQWPSAYSTLRGNDDSVNSVVFSPDGNRIASGSDDNTIRMWNSETGETVGGPMRGHDGCVRSVVFSPDGTRIASGSEDKTICIWNSETGEVVGEPMRGHDDWVSSVVFSPGGSRIASGSGDKTIRIWNLETGEAVGEPMRGHHDWVRSVVFSPDGSRIASGSDDSTIRIWNSETGETVGEPMRGHDDSSWVTSVVFSPDGSRIASGSSDRTIRMWNSQTGEALGEAMRGHAGWVSSVVFSPNGSRIASGSGDKTIHIWNSETGEAVGEPMRGHDDQVRSVVFSPDGSRIASGSGDKTIRIWNSETGETVGQSLQGHDDWVTSIVFSPDGSRIVSGSGDKTIRIWNSDTGEAVGKPMRGHDGRVTSVVFSPDGSRIASGSGDSAICIWNSETGEPVGEPMRGHDGCVRSVVFSPDGTRIASGSEDKTIRIWNSETGEAVGEPMRGHDDQVRSVVFSPDGSRIASGSGDRTICIWNSETGEAAGKPMRGHEDWVTSVVFSPDGNRIVSGSEDKTIRVWNSETGETVGEPMRGHDDWVSSVVFSPDGSRIASGSGDKTIRIWNSKTGEAAGKPMRGHDGRVTSVVFSPDGSRIASGSDDKTIHIWTPEIYDTVIKGGTENTIFFSQDGSRLRSSVSIDSDGWLVGPDSQLLLWIPDALRSSLPLFPTHTIIRQGLGCLLFDSSNFAHGTEWIRCEPK